jgi:hypothetical protein
MSLPRQRPGGNSLIHPFQTYCTAPKTRGLPHALHGKALAVWSTSGYLILQPRQYPVLS